MQMKFSKICRYVALLCSGLALGGCMLGPNFQPPEATLPDDWQENADVAFAQQTEEEKLAWWTQFNDPVLEKLIQTAYQQNLSLRTAGLRILEARARLALVKGNVYPQSQSMTGDMTKIGATGSAADRYHNTAAVGFDVAWEMDFWGKFRRSIESADAGLLADIASYDDVLVSLTAEVARTYIDIRTQEERIRLARQNTKIQQDALQLIIYQLEAGTVTELDVLQAKTLLSTTQATIPNLQSKIIGN